MKYQTVLFDLDGTLLNTLDDLNLSMQHTLEKFGLPRCTYEQTRARAGNGIKRLVELSLPAGAAPELFQRVHDEFVAYYSLHANDHTKPYEGVPELLKRLRAKDCRLAVVSNKNHEPVCNLVHQHFGDAFDAVLGVQEGIARKPERAMVDEALRRMGEGAVADAACGRAAYIGDSEVDVLTAANSELPCIVVTWGFRDYEQLVETGATCIVDTADGLYAAIASADYQNFEN